MSQRRTHGHPVVHELKLAPDHFVNVQDGSKPYEVRIDDREDKFGIGDYLWLREFSVRYVGYTLDDCMCLVTHILHGPCPDHGTALWEKANKGDRLTDEEYACPYRCCDFESFPGLAPGYVALGIKVLS